MASARNSVSRYGQPESAAAYRFAAWMSSRKASTPTDCATIRSFWAARSLDPALQQGDEEVGLAAELRIDDALGEPRLLGDRL